ncbi:uncharacterized protein LOC125017651 [Mugil cephalus]|uniref:uncharacterized protein LOC125017651 n=1 Tax=Mugil cephalus TaxID=48193 RepID=UPI001FB75F85|nr:uncharacterized protein LOC125017651 [Mugil cephalus]
MLHICNIFLCSFCCPLHHYKCSSELRNSEQKWCYRLTDGMEHFSRYLSINWTLTLILCCIFQLLLPAEGNISEVAGSTVTLTCNNNSIGGLSLLKWTMNGVHLFSFTPQEKLFATEEAVRLNMNMSQLESELYALIIEKAQVDHRGNYTCETITNTGVWQQSWQLIITDEPGKFPVLMIAVAVGVPCVCFLIFVLVFILLRRLCLQRNNYPPAVIMSVRQPAQREDIYENCLESEARRAYLQKTRVR